jgi:hypothetical protein
MRTPVLRACAFAACLALAAIPVRATSNHQYAKGEYGIISGGLAPNKQLSLASHGEGELGDENFHVWLMAEPAHRKIMALDDISSDNNLGTAPDAYHAFWSKDARHVGVGFRSSRHEVTLNLYRVENRKAYEIAGPDLFKEVTHRPIGDDDGLRASISMVEWHDGNRFRFRLVQTFITADDKFTKLLGVHGRVTDKVDDSRFAIEFSADAECELLPGDRTRVIDLKPGKPGDADTWWQP